LSEILYEFDASALKSSDRARRVLHSLGLWVLELIVILAIMYIFGIIGLIIAFLIIFLLPTPFAIVPNRYRIIGRSIICDDRREIPIQGWFKVKINEGRNYVSIHHPRRGEILRLYTSEPSKLLEIIKGVMSTLTP
jgi:uncharacterized membrane protein